VTFYDSDLQRVTRAEKIGRYTAFIEARTKGGEALRRTLTLFRAADGYGGSVSDNPAMTALAAGVPAGVVSAHADWVRAMSDSDPAESRRLRSTFAAQLAALFESSASGPAPCSRAMEENEVYRIQKLRGEAVSLPYVLTPSKGLDPATSKALTLLVFLHGTGNGNEKTALNAPIRRYALEHSDPPFLLVQPLCPPGTAWVPAQLDDLLNDLVSQYDIDPDQIIVTGFSMGGFGTWNLGIFYPGRFAALAPLAAYGEVSAVPAIGKTPVFAWHGDRDAIPWQRHRLTVEALNAAGGQGTFTLLPGINHTNTEEAVYLDPEFYRALWKAKRAEP
jgi:predicted esterase